MIGICAVCLKIEPNLRSWRSCAATAAAALELATERSFAASSAAIFRSPARILLRRRATAAPRTARSRAADARCATRRRDHVTRTRVERALMVAEARDAAARTAASDCTTCCTRLASRFRSMASRTIRAHTMRGSDVALPTYETQHTSTEMSGQIFLWKCISVTEEIGAPVEKLESCYGKLNCCYNKIGYCIA